MSNNDEQNLYGSKSDKIKAWTKQSKQVEPPKQKMQQVTSYVPQHVYDTVLNKIIPSIRAERRYQKIYKMTDFIRDLMIAEVEKFEKGEDNGQN
jgi:tyrosine-protein phosphatase YwqE